MTHAQAVKRINQSGIIGAAHGDLAQVKSLVEADAQLIDAMNGVNAAVVDETPQGAASHTQSAEIVQYFHEKGVKLDIFMAAAMGSAKDVRRLLKANPRLARARGSHGIPLIAHARDKSTAEAMVAGGVACDIFMAATFGLAKHAAKLLSKDPALKHAHNAQGIGPIRLAVLSSHKDVVKVLLKGGADDPDETGKRFLKGEEVTGKDWQGHYFHSSNLGASVFNNVNVGQASINNVNLRGAVLFNVNLANVIIDWATIDGLRIFGVEVKPLIDAELKKRR